ncbi:GtrA family protein [Candidatus Falkowbacteria bacterium]|nr:GtrA family protein [Candidatus Falkowbacteria bacterium]
MERILNFVKTNYRQFGKYFIVGSSGLVIDMSTLIYLKEIWGFEPLTAVVVNQIFLLIYIFTLNKYWSFKEKSLPHKQIVRFAILAGFNYTFAVASMYLFNHKLGFDYRLVRMGSIAMMVTWNFFLYKHWVYKE